MAASDGSEVCIVLLSVDEVDGQHLDGVDR